LETLTKQDLLGLAEGFELEGRSSMSKPELVGALEEQGVGLDALTKRELLIIGEGDGIEVRSSMTKGELIDAIAGSWQ
jgi:hypothetical protein